MPGYITRMGSARATTISEKTRMHEGYCDYKNIYQINLDLSI